MGRVSHPFLGEMFSKTGTLLSFLVGILHAFARRISDWVTS
jgi:hypothetical protein